jgi:hypothetical protein
MNDAVLLQQVWKGEFGRGDYEPLLELTRARNEAYCKKHDFDYDVLIGTLDPKYADVTKGGWVKIEMMQRALAKGYKYVVWLDPDALIKDLDVDLRDGCPKGIGTCWMRIPQLNHWNVGVLYMQNTWEVKNFINEWLSMYPGERQWMEQGEFNKLAMKGNVVETISDRWNATFNYSMVPDAVVLGYHGNGDANTRFELMRGTLEQLEAQ